MKRASFAALSAGAVVAILATVLWLQLRPPAPAGAEAVTRVTKAPAAPAPAAASAPAVRYPIDAAPAERPGSPLDVESALKDLFGSRAVQSMFQLDDLPRRVVATVDGLGRSQASSRLWPVNPAPGRFEVDRGDGGMSISADNDARYAAFVTLIEGVDLRRAVAAYARLYPSFQRAYEELGYPRRYFNDRLVDVVDQLLAAPELAAPAKVHLAQVNGPMQLKRPWLFYEFDDPALEALPAGQKILVRMGVSNERRVKARLAELRGLIAAPPRSR